MSTEIKDMELVPPSAVESITRAETDVAIATAKKYPRQLAQVKQSMLSFATLDVETAEGCFYTLPRGGKNIQGPSVRLAEIALSCYGNLQAGSRIIAVVPTGDTPHVVVQAVAKDLEKNITISVEKRRRIVKKKLREFIDEDDINLAANACSAICFRDAVFKVVPLALIKPVYEQARRVAIGDAKTLSDRRARCLDTFAKMGVTKEKVLARLELKSVEEIGLEHIEILIGLHNAIKEGEVNIDDAFAPTPAQQAAADQQHKPAATPLQQAQGTKTYDMKSAAAASMPAPAEKAQAPAQQQQQAQTTQPAASQTAKPRGRPPGSKNKAEKLTREEAVAAEEKGENVDPGAVETAEERAARLNAEGKPAEEAQETQAETKAEVKAETPEQSDEPDLAAMGLAPDPAEETQAAPTRPPFQPIPGENDRLTFLRQKMYDAEVEEAQLMAFCIKNKIANGEQKLKDFISNGRGAKIDQLIGVFGNPQFIAAVKKA